MRNLILSNDKITTFEICPRLYYFKHILLKGAKVKPKHLTEGELGHKCLEIYYNSILKNNRLSLGDYTSLFRNAALEFQDRLSFEETEEIITTVQKYLNYYSSNESWVIQGVEEPFAKVLLEDEKLNLRVIIQGRVDLRITTKDFPAIVDHKFLSKNRKIPSRDNQKLCYSWAFDVKDFFINVIGKQKSLKDSEKFHRPYFNYSPHQIEEWKDQTIIAVIELIKYFEIGLFPGRFTGCHHYDNNCLFTEVCDTTPDNWEYKLESYADIPEFDVMEGKSKEENE